MTDKQQIGVLSTDSPPSNDIGFLHNCVKDLGRFLRLSFALIFLAFAILNLNYLQIHNLATAWNQAAAKSEGRTVSRVPARKYNAAHAPVMSHPVPNQLHHNVVQALRTGQYKAFASMLDDVTESVVRQGVTIFAPCDGALSNSLMNYTLDELGSEDFVRFHIVTDFIPYSNLLRLKVGSRLTTDVSNVITLLVTNATAGSYQVDDAVIVEPDLYTAATIAVHGTNAVFNTTKIYEEELTEPVNGEIPVEGLPLTSRSHAFKTTNVAVKGIPVLQIFISSAVLFLIYLIAEI